MYRIMGVRWGAHLKSLVLLHSNRNLEQPVKVAIIGPVDWCWGRANQSEEAVTVGYLAGPGNTTEGSLITELISSSHGGPRRGQAVKQ